MTPMPGRYWFGLAVVLPMVAWAGVTRGVSHDQWTNDYDQYFRKYAKHYFGPAFDWHWFKAQGIAESGLRPRAKSPAGALGIMQIMPATYAEIKRKNPHFQSIDEPRWNIAAAIYYDRQLFRKWKKGVSGRERLQFTFASYNAGYGAVRKAYRKAERKESEVKRWKQVERFAPKETRRYVRRILRLMN